MGGRGSGAWTYAVGLWCGGGLWPPALLDSTALVGLCGTGLRAGVYIVELGSSAGCFSILCLALRMRCEN